MSWNQLKIEIFKLLQGFLRIQYDYKITPLQSEGRLWGGPIVYFLFEANVRLGSTFSTNTHYSLL